MINALLRWATPEQKKTSAPLGNRHRRRVRVERGRLRFRRVCVADAGGKARRPLPAHGQKLWITNAREAGLFIVFATIDPEAGYKGITAFLVDKRAPGFSVGKKEDKLGIRASSTCEFILEDCRVPAANVLGERAKATRSRSRL